MKRVFFPLLAAVFLSVLCIPCAATGTEPLKQRGYPGFSDIPSTDSLYFNSVSTLYEFGWLDPIGEDRFGVQEPLTKAEMVQLLARLYSLRLGSGGVIPPLPEDLGDYIRFYDGEGALVHNLFSAYCLDFHACEPQELTVTFWEECLPQERLTLEVGFPEDGPGLTAQGARLGYDPEDSCTRYRFLLPDGVNAQTLNLDQYQKDAMGWRSTWEVNRTYGLEDPTPYDAVLYLLWRTPKRLPLNFRTFFLDSQVSESVWRMEFAVPLSAICEALPEVRRVDVIPDLPDWRFGEDDTEAVLSLCRRGILQGFDEAGTFGGAEWLTRGQAALLAQRVLNALSGEN